MKLLKKAAPLAAALIFGAGALFGNPLESTVLKEDAKKEIVEFTGNADNKSFAIDASLPMGNSWTWGFNADAQFDTNFMRLNNVDTVIGNDRFFAGVSFGDLSSETLLKDSIIAKVQAGIRPWDWLDLTLTGAYVDLPNLKSREIYSTPMSLYAVGIQGNIGKKFDLGAVSLFPWISFLESTYYDNPVETDDYKMLLKANPDYRTLMSFPFDHFNIQAGLDLKTKFLDVGYQGTFDGRSSSFWNGDFPWYYPFNFTNKIDLSLHDKDKKFVVDYAVSLITKPPYSLVDIMPDFTRNELQFDLSLFNLFKNDFFIKAAASAYVNFWDPTQLSFTGAVGKKFKDWTLELYYNSFNNVVGIQGSTQLDRSTKRESTQRNDFYNSQSPDPTISSPLPFSSLNAIHQKFGNTLEDAIGYVHAHGEQGLSDLIAMIPQAQHDGTFTAKDLYENKGYGMCRDINGNLAVEIERDAFNYKNVEPITLRGPFDPHVIVLMEGYDGKYYARNYWNFYNLKAQTRDDAIKEAIDEAVMFGDGTVSSSVKAIRDAVERPLYDWTKFRKD